MSQVVKVLQNTTFDPNDPVGSPILGKLRTKRKIGCWYIFPPQIDENGNYLDKWGNPMELEIKESENKIFIKSLGKNGKDDGGGGDDFIMVDEYPPNNLEEIPHPSDYTQRNRPTKVEYENSK